MTGSSAGGGGRGGGGGGSASTLVGANDQALIVSTAPVATQVAIDAGERSTAFAMAPRAKPDRYYLNLEGVRGKSPSGALTVSIKPPGSDRTETVETVALFGLARASLTEGRHAGNGISVAIEITEQVHALQGGPVTPAALGVEIFQPGDVKSPITVDRVSIYKKATD